MADYGIRRYRLRHPQLRRGFLDGFLLEGDILKTDGTGVSADLILPALDSAVLGCEWGRLSLRSTLGNESILTIRAFASDEKMVRWGDELVSVDEILLDSTVPREEKDRIFAIADGVAFSGVQDALLYGRTGRYLWLWFEILGDEGGILEDIRVYVPGDNFLRTFPQVYQTDNDFFKRYLSVFSTMYQEFQEQIDALPELLNLNTAPTELLPVFASWMGLETDDAIIGSEELRGLLKIMPELMSRKGTRWAVERIVKIFVSGDVYIVEQNFLTGDQSSNKKLYGATPYDFTVMIGCAVDEKLRLKLRFLIDQFKPIRSNCRIVFLEEGGELDGFTYLDINSNVHENAAGSLDDGKALTGMTYLK